MAEEKTDYYKIIGVSPDISAEALRKAYRTALRDAHPDKPEGDAERFVLVQEAWATLGDPQKRENYDYLRQHPRTAKSGPEPTPAPSQTKPSSKSSSPSQTQSQATASPPKSEQASTRQPSSQSARKATATPSPQQETKPSYSTKAPNIDDVLGITPEDNPVQAEEQEEPLQAEEATVQEDITNLKKWKFIPSTSRIFQKASIGLALSLIATAIAFFVFLPSPFVFIPLGLVLIGAVILGVDYTGSNRKWGVGGMLLGALGFVVAFLLSDHVSEIVPLILMLAFSSGAAFTYSQCNEISKISLLDKQVPAKLLRQARVFGSAIGSTPDESVVLRNLSDQITPITNRLDGTFAIHVSETPMPNGQNIPTLMLVTRNNKACLLSAIGEQGNFNIDNSGNIIKISERFGNQHIRNINPQILKAGAYLEKQFKGVEAFSLVVMGRVPENKIVGKTIFTDATHVESALVDLFADDDKKVVRRDLINHYVPAITST